MLPTQVSYWNYVETQRHNFVTEDQTDRSIEETVRHNKRSEDLTQSSLNETIRHNVVSEDLTQQNLNETIRHNRVSEFNDAQRAQASLISANASMISANAARIQASAAERNAKTNALQASIADSRQKVDSTTALYNQRLLTAQTSKEEALALKARAEAEYANNENVWYDVTKLFNLVKPVIGGK